MRNVKVRFAPSPTGVPHVGNIRTALFNYFFAKSTGGKFILRIEDTDQARKVEGSLRAIEGSLAWLGVKWDKQIVQSANLKRYTEASNVLISKGKADRENGAVRFKVPKGGVTFWVDAVGEKKIEFRNSEIEDFIILKSDEYPTYHLANVVDDHAEGITHVIRGEDWIPSTPKHILMYKAFGWEDKIPIFAHVPNVLGTDGKKLSKRRGAKSVLDFKDSGFLPDALLNYLMLLGWSPKNDREILSKEEIEKEFKLENINTSPAIFDERKLLWMNGEYIRQLTIDNLQLTILEFDPSISSIPNFEKYIPLAQTRMKTLRDFRILAGNQRVALNQEQKKLAQGLLGAYRQLKVWDSTSISESTIAVRDQVGASTQDVYTVLTGRPQGLPFEQKLEIQGQGGTVSWLERMLKK